MSRLALAPIFKQDMNWVNDFLTDAPFKAHGLPVDIKETEKSFKITADLPGMKKEEINVDFHEGILTISASREENEEKEEGNYHRIERRKGSFSRSFRLGGDVDSDKIEASYTDGVLRVLIPKAETAQKRRIEIV